MRTDSQPFAPRSSWLRHLAVLLFLGGQLGCTGLEHCKSLCPPWHEAPPCGTVAKVVPLWADGVVVHPDLAEGGIPRAGFSGRFYLFGPEVEYPLKADGVLTVYLYDATVANDKPIWPLEGWEVKQDVLDSVLRKDGVGWGYDLWFPWRTYSPAIKKVVLRAVYAPKNGTDAPVWSEEASINLVGLKGTKVPSRVQMVSKVEGSRPAK